MGKQHMEIISVIYEGIGSQRVDHYTICLFHWTQKPAATALVHSDKNQNRDICVHLRLSVTGRCPHSSAPRPDREDGHVPQPKGALAWLRETRDLPSVKEEDTLPSGNSSLLGKLLVVQTRSPIATYTVGTTYSLILCCTSNKPEKKSILT